MRDERTPLLEIVESFFVHRHDFAPGTASSYRVVFKGFDRWCIQTVGHPAHVADLEGGIIETYLAYLRVTISPETARKAWTAFRSLARFLAERRIHHEDGESVMRLVRMPKVKDEIRRTLTDAEMWRLIERSSEGESGARDSAIVWTLLGCGPRRAELVGIRLGDLSFAERRIHIRAATSKSVHPRDVNVPVETLKALDKYVADYRVGDMEDDAPLFTVRRGAALSGNAIRKLFERLRIRAEIPDLCAHMLRHTWATNFHRSGSGTRFDLMTEGGWTTGRMVERYTKARPFEERRRAPSPFTAARKAQKEKRPGEMRPSQERSGLSGRHIA